MSDLFLPDHDTDLIEENTWKWYSNIEKELKYNFITKEDNLYITKYYCEAGLLKNWRRNFFRYHFSGNFSRAVQHIFQNGTSKKILDLGCGTGTQSLFFAMLGAEVISIDLDEQALRILNCRKSFYEEQLGRTLNISTYNHNASEFEYSKVAPIDGVYSMFAFNMMKPAKLLIKRLSLNLSRGSKFIVFDGNCKSWLPLLIPSRRRFGCLSPIEFENVLGDYSFQVVAHDSGFVLPPLVWFLAPRKLLMPIDKLMGRCWFMSISHQIVATKM